MSKYIIRSLGGDEKAVLASSFEKALWFTGWDPDDIASVHVEGFEGMVMASFESKEPARYCGAV